MYGLINGRIYTLSGSDWDKKPAEAMAVGDDGKIKAVGTSAEISAFLGEDAELHDLQGRVVMPGFIDSHAHIPGTAFTDLYEINLYGAFDKETTLERIRKHIESHPDEERYFGSGCNAAILQDGSAEMPVYWLDEICNDKPIYIKSYDGHTRWLNSSAMAECGITKDTKTNSSGLIGRNADGELNGVFSDVKDFPLKDPVYDEKQQAEALKYFMKQMNGWGYTSLLSQAPTFDIDVYTYNAVEAEGELTMRASIASEVRQKTMKEDLETLKKLRTDISSDKLKVTTAKFFLDGVLEGKTAYLKEPYCADAGLGENYNAPPEWEAEALAEAFAAVAKEGFQFHCHSIGDGATSMVLDALETVKAVSKEKDLRPTITHLHVVDEKDIERFAELDAIAALQPFWHLKEPDFFEFVEIPCLGKEKAEKVYPAKSFVNSGVRITASGDYPVSFMNNPFIGIRAGTTRNLCSEEYYGEEITDIDDDRYLLNPKERLSVKDMIEAYTINGAYQIFREKEVGSLEAGKCADFVVLSEDPMTIDLLKMDSIKVLATIFDGKKVFG